MKIRYLLLFIFYTSFIYSQKLTEKVGEIEIKAINHHYKYDSDFKLTKRKNNKWNRPYAKIYFDKDGLLLKVVSFGKYHNNSLKLLDKVTIYKYLEGKLVTKILYESDYDKNIYPYLKTYYSYNSKGFLTEESKYRCKNDSLFDKTTFEYDTILNKKKTIYKPTYYLQSEYDSINRLKSFKQIYNNKLRWEWNYKYTDTQCIGNFQTHYEDGKDYTNNEIQSYNDKNLLIEIEKIHSYKEKVKIYYYKNKIIKRIEVYKSFNDKKYDLISYQHFKIKTRVKITPTIAKKINNKIFKIHE